MALPFGRAFSLYFVKEIMFDVYVKRSQYWEKLPYASRGRADALRLAKSYTQRFPEYEYKLAPAGFTPGLAWVG